MLWGISLFARGQSLINLFSCLIWSGLLQASIRECYTTTERWHPRQRVNQRVRSRLDIWASETPAGNCALGLAPASALYHCCRWGISQYIKDAKPKGQDPFGPNSLPRCSRDICHMQETSSHIPTSEWSIADMASNTNLALLGISRQTPPVCWWVDRAQCVLLSRCYCSVLRRWYHPFVHSRFHKVRQEKRKTIIIVFRI